MRVGISGMGRIGRLALRAALGGAARPADDPRHGNRLEVVHLNENHVNASFAKSVAETSAVRDVDGFRATLCGVSCWTPQATPTG